MYVPFEQLPDEASVWIYQASRSLEPQEQDVVLQTYSVFLSNWSSHGKPLQGSAKVFYDRFLVIAAEESLKNVRGCAVDASVQLIRSLEQEFELDFLDRTTIAFKKEGGIFLVPLDQLREKIRQRIISAGTLTFDNTVTQKGALADGWIVRAGDSWLKNYF